jgi:predicted CopG family antitoxin
MPQTIRINDDAYKNLERLSEGFETPSETILRIAHDFEYQKIFSQINAVIVEKINIMKDEGLDHQTANIITHYNTKIIEEVMNDIVSVNSKYSFDYEVKPNSISINIRKD